MIRILFYILLLLGITGSIQAQHFSGRVLGTTTKQTKEQLPGANVYWLGTTTGTITDSVGIFHIPQPQVLPAKLVISMIGYTSDTIKINAVPAGSIEVLLKSTISLQEVNVESKQSTTRYSTFNPVNTEIISSKELLKAACCNLSESFSTNASVDVAFTDAVSGARKIQMLGLDGIYTQILSENMPMLRGLSAAYGLNYIPGTWIENIMVTKGTGSVVNGYESISGQINLEFLKPKEQEAPLFINLYGNHKGRAEANVHIAPKINEKWGTLLFLHASDVSL
ncbi:MAG: TonB-dependent receptor [Bacteroidia bacterium]